jgi:hypothetical protein
MAAEVVDQSRSCTFSSRQRTPGSAFSSATFALLPGGLPSK